MAARNPKGFVGNPSRFCALLAPRFQARILSFFRAKPRQDGISEKETARGLHFATVHCREYIELKGHSQYAITDYNLTLCKGVRVNNPSLMRSDPSIYIVI